MRVRRLQRLAFVAAAVLVVTVGLWLLAGSDGRRMPELGTADWSQVLGRLVSRAAAVEVHPPGPDELPRIGPAPSVRAHRIVEPVRPARLIRSDPDPAVLAAQAAAYGARRPKTVIDLQQFRRTDTMPLGNGSDLAALVNLNPTINAWYVLRLTREDRIEDYHLVNARPARQDLVLDPAFPDGLTIATSDRSLPCALWSPEAAIPIDVAASSPLPYVPLCDDQVVLRLPTAGRKTSLEKVTDFLRKRVWFGETLTDLVRGTFFEDAYLSTAELAAASAAAATMADPGPIPAAVDPDVETRQLDPVDLGFTLEDAPDGQMVVGRWYAAAGTPGISISVMRPDLVAPAIRQGHRTRVAELDDVESRALAYLVAFDLDRFDLGFTVGTDHPSVEWSDRVPDSVRDDTLPGPDGIGTIDPLVATGILGPAVVDRAAATFTGGFKRTHGGFRTGSLSATNHGSHYGFVESGAVLSVLQPGLATLVVMADGSVDMKTWQSSDNARLAEVRHARQNGVPILEYDEAAGAGVPSPYVNRWGPGNWSGAQDGRLRSLRAGACLQVRGSRRYLVYGYFSTATPSAMARVFQAYGCRYAMHLDMNALEHTYLAIYRVDDGTLTVEHLIRGMQVLDRRADDQVLPRFLGYADNRDFFYLLWRDGGAS